MAAPPLVSVSRVHRKPIPARMGALPKTHPQRPNPLHRLPLVIPPAPGLRAILLRAAPLRPVPQRVRAHPLPRVPVALQVPVTLLVPLPRAVRPLPQAPAVPLVRLPPQALRTRAVPLPPVPVALQIRAALLVRLLRVPAEARVLLRVRAVP